MKITFLAISSIVMAAIFLIGCAPSSTLKPLPPPQPVPEPAPTPSPDVINLVCTSSQECPEGYACYAELPLGPSAGIKGSPANPGKCYSNEMIREIN